MELKRISRMLPIRGARKSDVHYRGNQGQQPSLFGREDIDLSTSSAQIRSGSTSGRL